MTPYATASQVQVGINVSRPRPNRSGMYAMTVAIGVLTLHSGLARSADPAEPPAGTYKLDKAHASLVLRANHMGLSTYTTRFSRFKSELTFDPRNISASKVVTTIDASSFQMDAAPKMCLDIMKGPQMLNTAKFPQILFKSERVRMTGPKSMEISGTLTLLGVTRPMVLTAVYNAGYAGIPGMEPQARVGFSAHGSFKRSDFGMAFGIPTPGNTFGVGDLIDYSIEAEFTGPPLAAAPKAAP